jgi:chemotaxis methyl-accepting protein methylase
MIRFFENTAEHIRDKESEKMSVVEMAIYEIYGKTGVEEFNELWERNPNWTPEQAIINFEHSPVNPQTYFFRSNNLKTIAEQISEMVEKQEKEKQIKILQVGCSSGEESYSLATHMLEAGRDDFYITGIDVNADFLQRAENGEYNIYTTVDNVEAGWSKLKREHFENGYFEDSGKTWTKKEYIGPRASEVRAMGYWKNGKRVKEFPGSWWKGIELPVVRPTKRVREKVTFDLHDIIDEPVAGEYNIALINNVLNHYPERTREQILENVLKSLKAGGYLVLEHTMSPMSDEEREWLGPYNDWREDFAEKFNLKEIPIKVWWDEEETHMTGQYYQYLGKEE